MVRFAHGARCLGERVMDAVPREGEAVILDGETRLVVWNVAWQLPEGGEQVAWVALKTPRERNLALFGREDPSRDPPRRPAQATPR